MNNTLIPGRLYNEILISVSSLYIFYALIYLFFNYSSKIGKIEDNSDKKYRKKIDNEKLKNEKLLNEKLLNEMKLKNRNDKIERMKS